MTAVTDPATIAKRLTEAQMAMTQYDDGYLTGRRDESEVRDVTERRWFRSGVLCGIALSTLVWAFWP